MRLTLRRKEEKLSVTSFFLTAVSCLAGTVLAKNSVALKGR